MKIKGGKKMNFGTTEAGDASMNYEWVEKLDTVDGCIVITKNLTEKFINTLLSLKERRLILHASCTGYGGTVLEKHLPPYEETLNKIRLLIDSGFSSERIVLRVDPIIPTTKGINVFEKVVRKSREIIPDVKRIRISVLDMYPHVRKRFDEHHFPVLYQGNFQASNGTFEILDEKIKELKDLYTDISIESCAETKLPSSEAIGCVSAKDFEILNLKLSSFDRKGQRKNCLCVCEKKELLTFMYNQTGYNHCYGCLYCYWKTEKDT